MFDYFFTYGISSKNYLVEKLGISENKVFIRGNFSHLQMENHLVSSISSRRNQILYVGRFSEEKNVKTLISAFIDFSTNDQNKYNLILVGSGPLKDKLINYVNSFGYISNIEFIDYKNVDELIPYYQNSKLFVLPSYSEPWGQVVNEAMHFGLPIIISQNCGSVEDLCKENSIKFDPYKKNELTAIFSELLNNENKLERMSNASLEIIKNFVPKKLIQTQLALFYSILKLRFQEKIPSTPN